MSGSFKHAGASVARIPQAVLWGSKWLKNEENRGMAMLTLDPILKIIRPWMDVKHGKFL